MLNSLLLMVFIILSRLVVNDIKLIASGVNINNNNNNEQQSLFNTENKIDKKPTTTTKTRQNEELILTTTSTITSTTTQKELNDTTTILTSLLLTIMPPSTFSYNIHNNDQHQELIESILTEQTIMTNNEEKLAHSQSELFVIPIISDENANDCTECDLDYCLENIHYNKNCTKLIRDQCNCCTVCLRYIDETCGGKLNVRGICDNGLNCENINVNNNKRSTEQIGKCVKSIDCSNVDCGNLTVATLNICPSDSYLVTNLSTSTNNSTCCSLPGHCQCSPCARTICGEGSNIQIFRTGTKLPGNCCDQFHCIKNTKTCHHNKKIYQENETWTIDHCTTCKCRGGLVDCNMVQCPANPHCGYMYKPETECCPKCAGCLSDTLHIQEINSTWIESNGCIKCFCENGWSRCFVEGCIAPPCENPRQIANVCCPICDDPPEYHRLIDQVHHKNPHKCPLLTADCKLECEHGLSKDERGCLTCQCLMMTCPSFCILKYKTQHQQYCQCNPTSPFSLVQHSPLYNCTKFNCDKNCPYNYSVNQQTGCPYCECNPCPILSCTKNCTYGLRKNEVGCPICVCESNSKDDLNNALLNGNGDIDWPRQCQSGQYSYSNGEIWFDGCRQCLCHKGEHYCALISCPVPKCLNPILLPNRCCPSCPGSQNYIEPATSQVCYQGVNSAYVSGEELEFDKCTKCVCLNGVAFCSVAFCPPLRCSNPIYNSSLCCPVCPPSSSAKYLIPYDVNISGPSEICLLDNGLEKNEGELWKPNDCESCICYRGKVECFSQTCPVLLTCPNPVLKKGQCCPYCIQQKKMSVCVFNYIQYRSGEHWNVSDCHRCECSFGTIVCHQHKCPAHTCVYTVTLPGNCCPICRDQLPSYGQQQKIPVTNSSIEITIILGVFAALIIILVVIVTILIIIILRRNTPTSSNDNHHAHVNGVVGNGIYGGSGNIREHISTTHTASSNISKGSSNDTYSYVKYDLISKQTLTTSNQLLMDHDSHHQQPITDSSISGQLTETEPLTEGICGENEEDLQEQCFIERSSYSRSDDQDDNDSNDQQQTLGAPTIIYI